MEMVMQVSPFSHIVKPRHGLVGLGAEGGKGSVAVATDAAVYCVPCARDRGCGGNHPGASYRVSASVSPAQTGKAGGAGRAVLMHLRQGTAAHAKAFAALGITSNGGGIMPTIGKRAVGPLVTAKEDTIRVIKALRMRKDVLYAEPNYIVRPTATVPNDKYYPLQWHYPLINLPQAWEISTGTDAIVAVIDTGVLLAHPDLQGQLLPGYDFISDPAMALDGDGIDNNPNDPGDGGQGNSSIFHGTHVAGTIAAATNNDIGVAGIAWNARIMPLRALGKGGGTLYDIDQAIRYAAGLSNDSGTLPARRADIINLSLGGGGYSRSEQDVVTQARNQGVIIVAAAGNDAGATPYYPASYDGVVSVSDVGIDKTLAPYSNYGPDVDVAAPGGDMSADRNNDGYICDIDEACGTYPSLDHPTPITVSGDGSNRDFPTGFALGIHAQGAGGGAGRFSRIKWKGVGR